MTYCMKVILKIKIWEEIKLLQNLPSNIFITKFASFSFTLQYWHAWWDDIVGHIRNVYVFR